VEDIGVIDIIKLRQSAFNAASRKGLNVDAIMQIIDQFVDQPGAPPLYYLIVDLLKAGMDPKTVYTVLRDAGADANRVHELIVHAEKSIAAGEEVP